MALERTIVPSRISEPRSEPRTGPALRRSTTQIHLATSGPAVRSPYAYQQSVPSREYGQPLVYRTETVEPLARRKGTLDGSHPAEESAPVLSRAWRGDEPYTRHGATRVGEDVVKDDGPEDPSAVYHISIALPPSDPWMEDMPANVASRPTDMSSWKDPVGGLTQHDQSFWEQGSTLAPRGSRYYCPSKDCGRLFARQGDFRNHLCRFHAELDTELLLRNPQAYLRPGSSDPAHLSTYNRQVSHRSSYGSSYIPGVIGEDNGQGSELQGPVLSFLRRFSQPAQQADPITNDQDDQSDITPRRGSSRNQTTLKGLTLRFAKIPYLDFVEVDNFIRRNPGILETEHQALLEEAKRAFMSSEKSFARTCVQQAVVLQLLKDRPPTVQRTILDDLVTEDAQFMKQFFKHRDSTWQQVAGAASNVSPSSRPTVAEGSPRLFTELAFSRDNPNHNMPYIPFAIAGNANTTSGITNTRKDALERYIVRPSSFFKAGRVFAVLWYEPGMHMRGMSMTTRSTGDSTDSFGQAIYTTVRRMVVVREDHGFCVCIQISTYGGRGLAKFRRSHREVEAHSRIRMSGTEAKWLGEEPISSKQDIEVHPASGQRLDPSSRLCYSRPHTVEHTVKAMEIGRVAAPSLPYLMAYFQDANRVEPGTSLN
ncbi:hypothetical protein A1O1_05079 [Capronia coronata CBS 617.96]|uniref:C2H2-type domain-containing protein n=1 Tax=Capronia coronata CBS 617.96 TaxID=1182541 RepID=W9YFW6_9EURO|nr:uncharacterized protein A1O1_05079 [Capronia coronata CBS 617.96]EXJ88151.1 hypothetical protein A1O1_05079 [Capronia coronata CBS 617.96]